MAKKTQPKAKPGAVEVHTYIVVSNGQEITIEGIVGSNDSGALLFWDTDADSAPLKYVFASGSWTSCKRIDIERVAS